MGRSSRWIGRPLGKAFATPGFALEIGGTALGEQCIIADLGISADEAGPPRGAEIRRHMRDSKRDAK